MMELCYLFSLIILVIYDGGRHLIEIAYARTDAHPPVGQDKTEKKERTTYIRCMTTTVKLVIAHKNDN